MLTLDAIILGVLAKTLQACPGFRNHSAELPTYQKPPWGPTQGLCNIRRKWSRCLVTVFGYLAKTLWACPGKQNLRTETSPRLTTGLLGASLLTLDGKSRMKGVCGSSGVFRSGSRTGKGTTRPTLTRCETPGGLSKPIDTSVQNLRPVWMCRKFLRISFCETPLR